MRLTTDQARLGITSAMDCALEVQHDDDPGRPPWIELEAVDGTDLNLLSVRFPGRCQLRQEKLDEILNDGEETDGYAIGIFVILIDTDGTPAFARHTAAGALNIDRHGRATVQGGARTAPSQTAHTTETAKPDNNEKVIEAFKKGPERRLSPQDICQRSGLDFLTVAGSPTPRGKSLLDLMVDEGQLVRDTSSGFHLYELPKV